MLSRIPGPQMSKLKVQSAAWLEPRMDKMRVLKPGSLKTPTRAISSASSISSSCTGESSVFLVAASTSFLTSSGSWKYTDWAKGRMSNAVNCWPCEGLKLSHCMLLHTGYAPTPLLVPGAMCLTSQLLPSGAGSKVVPRTRISGGYPGREVASSTSRLVATKNHMEHAKQETHGQVRKLPTRPGKTSDKPKPTSTMAIIVNTKRILDAASLSDTTKRRTTTTRMASRGTDTKNLMPLPGQTWSASSSRLSLSTGS
mmetsp:Transcript_1284/g.3320  ORF Transcript_1284/g.3320 Transcript_1284/m.3320 type:complete len:255 (+) Transcript_1284:747-1511(+)